MFRTCFADKQTHRLTFMEGSANWRKKLGDWLKVPFSLVQPFVELFRHEHSYMPKSQLIKEYAQGG